MSKKEKLQDQPTPEETKAPETELTETDEPVPEEQEAPQAPEINWEEKYNAEHDTYLRLAAMAFTARIGHARTARTAPSSP